MTWHDWDCKQMLSCGSCCCLHLDAQCCSCTQEWPCLWWVLAHNFSEAFLPQLCLLVETTAGEITSAAWAKLAHWNRHKSELTWGVQPPDLQGYCTASLVQLLAICSATSSCPYPAYFPLLRVLWKHSPYPNFLLLLNHISRVFSPFSVQVFLKMTCAHHNQNLFCFSLLGVFSPWMAHDHLYRVTLPAHRFFIKVFINIWQFYCTRS